MLCCGIKPLCGWNAEQAASVCRERCGGQGYLSVNKFGSILGFAHAGGPWGGGAWHLHTSTAHLHLVHWACRQHANQATLPRVRWAAPGVACALPAPCGRPPTRWPGLAGPGLRCC